jgi:hypothetical protein
MLPIFKPEAALPDELEKELVDDAGRLQKMPGPLATKQSACDPSQLRIDKLKEAVQRVGLAGCPFAEEDGNLTMLAFVVRHTCCTQVPNRT